MFSGIRKKLTSWLCVAAVAIAVFAGTARASYSNIFETSAASSNGSPVTTSAQNTTGAKLIVVTVAWFKSSVTAVAVTDSLGNTWTPLTGVSNGANYTQQSFYCINPTVGTSHTFTAGIGAGSGLLYPTIGVAAFSCTGTPSLEAQNSNTGTVSPLAAGSVTPAENGDLIVTGINAESGTSIVIDSGFTASTQNYSSGADMGGGIAYLIQTTAATVNPNWSWTPSGGSAASIAVFTSSSSPATTLTLTGPTSGAASTASTNFTVTPNGTTSDTVTPHSTGSGTFSPASLTWSNSSAPQTFTYTPATTVGSPHSISITDTASLTISGSPISYTVTSGPVTVLPTDANLFFSPFNWMSDGAGSMGTNNIRASSTYAQANGGGPYIKLGFTGTSLLLNVNTAPNVAGESASNYPKILYQVDTGAWTSYQVQSTDTQITIATALAAGNHSAEIRLIGAWWADDRWNSPISVLRVTGFQIDAGASTIAPTLKPGRALLYWDSQGEGYEALGVGVSVALQDASQSASALIGDALNCEIGVVAYAGQGIATAGGGNVPALTTAWDHYDSTHSRLISGAFSPAPDWIICLHGQNDSAVADATITADITSLNTAWRAAAPNAKIVFCAGPNISKASAIQAGVTNAADAKTKYATTGVNFLGAASGAGAYNNDNHLSVRGQAIFGASITAQIEQAFSSSGTGTGATIMGGRIGIGL